MADFCERPEGGGGAVPVAAEAQSGIWSGRTAESSGDVALHWYDFLCPFCYVAQDRNARLERGGWRMEEMGFQAHPEIPAGGIAVGPRVGAMYTQLESEARAAGLPLRWPARLPDTRGALAAAEWTRRNKAQCFPALQRALFAAHFAMGEDLGDVAVVERHAAEAGVDLQALRAAMADGTANAALADAERQGRRYGVRGTPAWWIGGELISGLLPAAEFDRLAAAGEEQRRGGH